MNDKKICFVMCCNDDYYVRECYHYLEELVIPKGYEVEISEIRGAHSMAAGYNEGMRKSDAKYKIYLHQDVFIINKNFLVDMLNIFLTDTDIGMIGMVGTPYMIQDGTMWNGIRYGAFYKLQEYVNKKIINRFFPIETGYMEMEAIDGLLMATQYDLPWRDDIFKKWDFYDASQSFEFLRAGYKVVVPGQNPEWYIHDCGAPNLINYEGERVKFLKEYLDYMEPRQTQTWSEYLMHVRESIKKGFHGTEQEKVKALKRLDDLENE